ncbi:hypothetical protein C8F04DRAFT_1195797 [Mycena alexandri]|uniref:Uncharacterized protein n=1 Tax=Mycena alexandri TaxID=1745969 RepID=A0AAD6S6J2_9AGAR|nr:hypothetical protein C8F04DRAFT_1195797 [Mycena alexandri]
MWDATEERLDVSRFDCGVFAAPDCDTSTHVAGVLACDVRAHTFESSRGRAATGGRASQGARVEASQEWGSLPRMNLSGATTKNLKLSKVEDQGDTTQSSNASQRNSQLVLLQMSETSRIKRYLDAKLMLQLLARFIATTTGKESPKPLLATQRLTPVGGFDEPVRVRAHHVAFIPGISPQRAASTLELACERESSRSTRSGAIFSPYAVRSVDIADFMHREEERMMQDFDEELVELEPIDLNLDLPEPQLPAVRPVAVLHKRRATPSAAAVRAATISSRTLPHTPPAARLSRTVIPRVTQPVASKVVVPRAAPAIPIASKIVVRRTVAPFWQATIAAAPARSKIVVKRDAPTPASAPAGSKILVKRDVPSALSASTPPTVLPLIVIPRTAAQIHKRKYHRRLRSETREEQRRISSNPRRKAYITRRIQKTAPIFAELDVSHLEHTSTAWLGVRVSKKRNMSAHTLDDIHDPVFNMQFLNWDGWACRPIIDRRNRLFALLAGRPAPDSFGYDSYQQAIAEATRLFLFNSVVASGNGRRGPFSAVSVGISYGGGQMRPGVLLNNKTNTTICAAMLANWAFHRIIGFSNFTRLHIDAANLVWGWCCITAFGIFNPDLGGHLILWDLRLVIRFPPGSTIMIPSALLRHSNISIQQGETRYSFTQFSAGGLFRWVENGNRSDKAFFANASAAELRARENARGQRWENGLKMFQVWNPKTKVFESQME